MNEEKLKSLLRQQAQRRPEENDAYSEAKQRTIQQALDVFDEEAQKKHSPISSFFQGFWLWLRLRRESQSQMKEKEMSKSISPRMFGGVATASVAILAFTFVYMDDGLNQGPQTDVSVMEEAARPAAEPLLAKRDQLAQDTSAEVLVESRLADKRVKVEAYNRSSISQLSEAAGSQQLFKPSRDLTPPTFIRDEGRDQFEHAEINPVKQTATEPVSTFSIDVDTASYSFVRQSLNSGRLPPKDAVRIEEMINYFDYQYPQPELREQPFQSSISVLPSPWNAGNKLVHIGLKAFDIQPEQQPRSNLVFLLDVSGSMNDPDKLPLVKQSMQLLLSKLQPEDTIAIAVYAGAAGVVLEPTPVKEKATILAAMNRLNAGGSTAGAEGIQLAYQLAEQHFDLEAVNRIILATDGDFNVGITDREALKGFVERKRDKGIFLSVLGFGQGNYNDHLMQVLAQNGNGVAAYIDTLNEAQKVLVEEAHASLFPVAKDVKIQVEFNPNVVSEYRLIGYETRALKNQDFNNDKVDAGDIGAGHSVTAIYEVTPVGSSNNLIEPLRYSANKLKGLQSSRLELGFLKMRYKLPESSTSILLEAAIPTTEQFAYDDGNYKQDVEFSVAVAGFAQLLKDERYMKDWSFDDALALAQKNRGEDPYAYRAEFVQLIRKAKLASEL